MCHNCAGIELVEGGGGGSLGGMTPGGRRVEGRWGGERHERRTHRHFFLGKKEVTGGKNVARRGEVGRWSWKGVNS